MKIKRFFAENMQEAIRLVRENLGDEAAILSNRKTDKGVEVVAAVEYDDDIFEQQHEQSTDNKRNVLLEQAQYNTDKHKRHLETNVYTKPVADSLPQMPSRQAKPQAGKGPRQQPVVRSAAMLTSGDDPLIKSLQQEIHSLRDLLQDELAGLIWRDHSKESATEALVFKRLRALGISAVLAKKITHQLDVNLGGDEAFRKALADLSQQIHATGDDILEQGGVVSLIGPTGVGKTTTIAKLAAQFSLKHGPDKVALLTTDCYRVAAHEQLKIYGKLLNLPVRAVNDEKELRAALRAFSDKKLVLIDTAGMSSRDLRLQEQLSLFGSKRLPVRNYLVLAATSQRLVLESAVTTFSRANIHAVIVTKIDEGVSIGSLLSLIVDHKLPVSYLTHGQRVPEDISVAHSHNLVSSAVTMVQQYEQLDNEKSLATAFSGREVDVDA